MKDTFEQDVAEIEGLLNQVDKVFDRMFDALGCDPDGNPKGTMAVDRSNTGRDSQFVVNPEIMARLEYETHRKTKARG